MTALLQTTEVDTSLPVIESADWFTYPPTDLPDTPVETLAEDVAIVVPEVLDVPVAEPVVNIGSGDGIYGFGGWHPITQERYDEAIANGATPEQMAQFI